MLQTTGRATLLRSVQRAVAFPYPVREMEQYLQTHISTLLCRASMRANSRSRQTLARVPAQICRFAMTYI